MNTETAADSAAGPGRRLLIVDDHDRVRSALGNWIGTNFPGLILSEACDAETALRMLERVPVDVVLMDIGLPGMSGTDATREVLKRWPKTAVVMISIFDGEPTHQAALAAGARDFVAKRHLRTGLQPVLARLLAAGGEQDAVPR